MFHVVSHSVLGSAAVTLSYEVVPGPDCRADRKFVVEVQLQSLGIKFAHVRRMPRKFDVPFSSYKLYYAPTAVPSSPVH